MHSLLDIFDREAGFRQIFPISNQTWVDILLFYLSIQESELLNHLIVCRNEEEVLQTKNKLSSLKLKNYEIIESPFFETYTTPEFSQTEQDYLHNFSKIRKLFSSVKNKIIIGTLGDFFFKLPVADELTKRIQLIKNTDINFDNLPETLINFGYKRVDFISSPYTFSIKGSSLDIFDPEIGPHRVLFEVDIVYAIFALDLEELKINKEKRIEEISVGISPYFVLDQKEHLLQFKKNLKTLTPQNKTAKESLNQLYERLKHREFTPLFFKLFSFFFNKAQSIFEIIPPQETMCHFLFDYNFLQTKIMLLGQEGNKKTEPTHYPLQKEFYQPKNEKELPNWFNTFFVGALPLLNSKELLPLKTKSLDFISFKEFLVQGTDKLLYQKKEFLGQLIKALKTEKLRGFQFFIFFNEDGEKKRFQNTLTEHRAFLDTQYFKGIINQSLISYQRKIVILSLHDFYTIKKTYQKRQQSHSDLISDFFANLKVNDFVIHKEHGVAKYLGINKIKMADSESEFLTLEFANSDKVYVPIYKVDLIQQCPSEGVRRLDILGGARFSELKKGAKKSIKTLAFNLIQLNAKRSLEKAYAFQGFEDDSYNEFCETFPFEETEDQLKAINQVFLDLSKTKPMDRIICGDVGNGKTEVAMRASFIAAYQGKQVAILVPTTVLALQHYNNFAQRLSPFGLQVEYLSRFSSEKKTKRIIKDVANGVTDILIGTHKILSKKIEFKNLELLIIDEEHKFGVNHKEVLKNYKTNIHSLSMTATPIPRTLQMSLLNIREISLIKTPPRNRKPISSYIINFNDMIILNAINFELARKGQVIFINNRVQNIEEIVTKIKSLAPHAKITFAHGKLPPKTLEKRITDFYNGLYDILISTAIIESGIDIPTANTILINNSHQFGLSQLHQLKGRIGRSNIKAYAYFIIPENKSLTEEAYKRLEVLQSFSSNPTGLTVSMKDLDIRGPGDLLGAEQSGHLNNIGIELYLDLLNEATAELKGEKAAFNETTDLQIPVAARISDRYIPPPSLRLKFYKMLSNASTINGLDEIRRDIVELFGTPDADFHNLVTILKIKIYLKSIKVLRLKVGKQKIELNFSEKHLSNDTGLQSKLFSVFTQNRQQFKIVGNNSVECLFSFNNNIDELLKFFKNLHHKITN